MFFCRFSTAILNNIISLLLYVRYLHTYPSFVFRKMIYQCHFCTRSRKKLAYMALSNIIEHGFSYLKHIKINYNNNNHISLNLYMYNEY